MPPAGKRPAPRSALRRLRAALVPTAAAALAAMGLWRCTTSEGEPHSGLPHTVLRDTAPNAADPTLRDEAKVLRTELSEANALRSQPADTAPLETTESESSAADTDADTGAPDTDALFPLYAVAYHFHTQIFEGPSKNSKVVAAARRGARFRVSERRAKGDCPKGWYALSVGGFVCNGEGVLVAREPVAWDDAPPPPDVNAPLPYTYMYVARDGVVQYWKAPTAQEREQVARILERRRAAAAQPAPQGNGEDGEDAMRQVLDRAAHLAARAEEGAATDLGPPDSEAPDTTGGDTESDSDPLALPSFVHMVMNKGFFVTVRDKVTVDDADFFRTIRGRYIRADALYPISPSSFEGVAVSERVPLPIAFVVRGGARMYHRTPTGKLRAERRVSRLQWFLVHGEWQRGAHMYYQVGPSSYLSEHAVSVARRNAPPPGIGPEDRWIDIDLSEQVLVAYQGTTPVFATVVSTGKTGFETPTGLFRVYNKHVSIIMDNPDDPQDAYSIEDVPWTQYFKEGYALHTAFWHDRFGTPRSHGCVNLSPKDARRLFLWTTPRVPDGIHSVVSSPSSPGTAIYIHP